MPTTEQITGDDLSRFVVALDRVEHSYLIVVIGGADAPGM
jgi:hypothetical protein